MSFKRPLIIRPPSEWKSYFLPLTSGCSNNTCTFCGYFGSKLQMRDIEGVRKEIDALAALVSYGLDIPGVEISPLDYWDGKRVFLQDADSLVIKPSDLVEILKHLKKRFPKIERITSYARSHTIARMKNDDLRAIGAAGLNRLHIGLESGSNTILKMVKKGSTKEMHIRAGLKVKRAGIELSEYIMPGLGGRELSEENALETADALNPINPDFIRFRTLGIPNQTPLYESYRQGHFQKCTDVEVVREILTFTENIDGITSFVTSDHILNLLAEFEGKLPDDKERMIGVLRDFLAMKPAHQRLYQVGRRLGIFSCIQDMDDPRRLAKAERTYREIEITHENADEITDELMKRFI